VAESSKVNRTFCKMDLQSLVMHGVWLYFKASQQDVRLWFLERGRAGSAVSGAVRCRLWAYLAKELHFSGGVPASRRPMLEMSESCISGGESGVGLER